MAAPPSRLFPVRQPWGTVGNNRRELVEMDGETRQETYTAEQREQLESGLRILARMIVRAHLRRQQEPSPSGDGSGPETSAAEDDPDTPGAGQAA